jgi:fusion and transport protein UGO1
VELRPAPYNGVVDTLWHILTEERSDLPIHVRATRGSKSSKGKQEKEKREYDEDQSWFRNTGLGQLYRGLGMRLGASVIVFVLAIVSSGEEKDSGWAEM